MWVVSHIWVDALHRVLKYDTWMLVSSMRSYSLKKASQTVGCKSLSSHKGSTPTRSELRGPHVSLASKSAPTETSSLTARYADHHKSVADATNGLHEQKMFRERLGTFDRPLDANLEMLPDSSYTGVCYLAAL